MAATTKGRPAATGRPFQTQRRDNSDQIDAPRRSTMYTEQSTAITTVDQLDALEAPVAIRGPHDHIWYRARPGDPWVCSLYGDELNSHDVMIAERGHVHVVVDFEFKVGDLVLIRPEGGRQQFAAIAYLTDDETFPYIVRTETGPLVVRADEVHTVTVTEGGDR